MRLIQAHGAAAGGSPAQRGAAERFWPATAVVEQLAYRTLAAWATALYGGEDAGEEDRLPDPDGVLRLHTVLSGLAAAAETGQVPAPLGKLPALLQSEIHAAHEVLSARWREASARQGLG
jgi:hypothetical protein